MLELSPGLDTRETILDIIGHSGVSLTANTGHKQREQKTDLTEQVRRDLRHVLENLVHAVLHAQSVDGARVGETEEMTVEVEESGEAEGLSMMDEGFDVGVSWVHLEM